MATDPTAGDADVPLTPEGCGPGREALLRFLQTDESDAGCERTLELLHVYVEQVLAGDDPERTYPGITAHLRACGPCLEDFDGLLQAARGAGLPEVDALER